METINKKLLDPKENRKYYSTLDTRFMPFEEAMMCCVTIPRLGWARNWIHKIKAKNVLDIGGIDGFFDVVLAMDGLSCINIEPMEKAVLWGKDIAQTNNLDIVHLQGFYEDQDIAVKLAEYMDHLEIDKFDVMACMETLEHVLSPKHFLDWASQRAYYMIFSTPDAYGRFGHSDAHLNPGHIRLYTEQELKEELEPYGDILEIKKENDILLAVLKVKK